MKDIICEYRGHCGYVYAFPVRNINVCGDRVTYEIKEDCIIGFAGYDVNHFLLKTLNEHINPDLQFAGNIRGDYPDYFEENGWNFYTGEAILCIVRDIRNALNSSGKKIKQKVPLTSEEIEFCKNISDKLEKMVEVSSDYEYILFMGS